LSTLLEPAYLPADQSEVTTTWLLEALAPHPTFESDPISTASMRELGVGMGQLSALSLADLECESGARHQVVVKLHTSVPDMHDIAMRYEHYDSEINFYNHLADHVPLRTPEIYAARMNRETGRVLIIMESFAGWHSPDQLTGATPEEVAIAADRLAGLTAYLFDAPAMERYPWLRNLHSSPYGSLADDYRACTDIMLDRLGDRLPEGSETAMREIGGRFEALKDLLCSGHQALAHWDYRVENLFYGPDEEFAVIDWQLMMMTNPANDLAYLLSTNIGTELRREVEQDIMTQYAESLARHGVQNYSRADLEHDYRTALLGISGIPVIGGAGYDVENARSHELFAAIGARLFQTIEDWDALDLLPQ
jgi:aminoglycoside phosphotransferase (APT) family kinase protein